MHKVRDNYTAEIIILIVVTVMFLTSCGSTYTCPSYGVNDTECMYANQEWDRD
jgi:hypothetical protein